MDVYKFDDALIKKLKDQGVKFIDLVNAQGEKVVPRNQNAKQLPQKIAEVKQRLKSLPDGVYTLGAFYNANPTIKGDKYFIGKGNYKNVLLSETAPEIVTPAPRKKVVADESEHVLSYAQALKNIQEIERLRADVARLETELAAARAMNLELREEIAELESESGNGGLAEGIKEIFSPIAPLLPTLADQYFAIENRKLNLQEAKQFTYMQERGIFYPGQKNGNGNGSAQKRGAIPQQQQRKQQTRQLPDVNDANAMNEYCDYLEKLSDDEFNAELDQVEKIDPTLYAVLEQVFFSDSDEDQESDENE
jgi:hypothetical protein